MDAKQKHNNGSPSCWCKSKSRPGTPSGPFRVLLTSSVSLTPHGYLCAAKSRCGKRSFLRTSSMPTYREASPGGPALAFEGSGCR
jgi:hypothetical protein